MIRIIINIEKLIEESDLNEKNRNILLFRFLGAMISGEKSNINTRKSLQDDIILKKSTLTHHSINCL